MSTMTPGAKFRAALKEERPLQVPGAICAYHATLAKASIDFFSALGRAAATTRKANKKSP